MGGEQRVKRHKRLFCITCLLIFFLFGSGCRNTSLKPLSSTFFEKNGDSHLKKAEQYIREGEFDAALSQNEQCDDSMQKEALLQKGIIYAHPACPFRDETKARECFDNLIEDMVQVQSHIYNKAVVFQSLLDDISDMNNTYPETIRELRQNKNKQVDSMNTEISTLKSKIVELEEEVLTLQKQIENMKQVDLNLEEKKLGPLK